MRIGLKEVLRPSSTELTSAPGPVLIDGYVNYLLHLSPRPWTRAPLFLQQEEMVLSG